MTEETLTQPEITPIIRVKPIENTQITSVNRGKGRPRKDNTLKFNVTTFYWPSNKEHDILWQELDIVIAKVNIPEVYNRRADRKRSQFIKSLILKYIYEHTEKPTIRDIIEKIMTNDNNERSRKYYEDFPDKKKEIKH